jgi:hypothetical protein
VNHRRGDGTPRLGIKRSTHYVSVGEALRPACRRDSLGYDTVWVTEERKAPDAVIAPAAMAAQSERPGSECRRSIRTAEAWPCWR